MEGIAYDTCGVLDTTRWLWEYFAARNWQRPPRSVCLDFDVLDATVASYVRAYLRIVNPAGKSWPKGAICPVRFKNYLIRLVPALRSAGSDLLTYDEIQEVDAFMVEFDSITKNNGAPMLPLCVELAQLWVQATGRTWLP